jgi:hypothetical protein
MELEFNVWSLHYAKCKGLGETFPKFTRREKPRKQGRILHLLLKSDKDLTPSYGSYA